MSFPNATLNLPASVRGAFFRDLEHQGGAGNFTPAAAIAHADDGLKVLRNDISNGTPEERELAVDILVNLAAGTDEDARKAQDSLRGVYADPRCGDAASNARVRRDIENLAHRLCQLALDPPLTDGKPQGSNPRLFNQREALSLTVAYLGARAGEPPTGNNGGAMKSHIENFVKQQVSAAPAQEQLLGTGRTIDGKELLPAASKLKAFSEKPVLLELYPDTADASLQQAMFVEPLKALVERLDDSDSHCAAALVNVGDPGFQHWMPVVLHTDDRGNVHCHVMDSDKAACDRRGVHARLEKLLDQVFDDPNHVHIHKSDMQTRPAGAQACAALSLNLLTAVDRQIQFKADDDVEAQAWEKEASVGCGMDEFDMGGFIESHMAEWNGLDDDSQHARMAATRAQLLDAWSDAPLPLPSAPIPVSSVQGGVSYENDAIAVGEPKPPAPAMPSQLKAALDSYSLTKANDSQGKTIYRSSLSEFADTRNRLEGLGNLKASGLIGNAPRPWRPLLTALADYQKVVAPLDRDSPLLGNYGRESAFAELAKKLIDFGPAGMVPQLTTRLPLLMSDLVALAVDAAQPGPAGENALASFRNKLQEVQTVMAGFRDKVAGMVQLLEALRAQPQNSRLEQWGARGQDVTARDRQVHADADKLLLALRGLQTALADSNSPLQSFARFAGGAAAHSQEMAAAMRAKVGA